MRIEIIKVGNSKGVILPTNILKHLKLSVKSAVDINIIDDSIVIKPAPRQGWADAAKKMHECGDDRLDMPDVFHDEKLPEWE